MRTKSAFVVSLSALAIFASSISLADNHAGATTLQLADGYYFFAEKRHVQNTALPNIALSYNLNKDWALQAGAGVFNTNQTGTAAQQGVHGWVYSVDGIYRLNPRGRLAPYLLAGPTIISLKPAGNNPVNQAAINAGIGTQYFIDKQIAFFAEAKDFYTISGGKNDGMLNFGMSFLFGGDTTAA
jgi:hypothetical protein